MADVDGLAARSSLGLDGVGALVAGAGGGIGITIARAFSDAGAAVCVHGITPDSPRLRSVAGAVDERDACRQVVQRVVAAAGGLGVLVHCVGVEAVDIDTGDVAQVYHRLVHRPLRRLFFLTQAAHVVMKRHGGRIVNVAPAVVGDPARATAAAAVRAGLAQLTKTMAVEWAEDGIRANCVVPAADPGGQEDVAALVVALASRAAAQVSGELIRVDGGATVGGSWDRP